MSIKTLSPYLITIPLVNPITSAVCLQFTVKVYVWAGERDAVPAEPVYSITKINAAGSSGTDRIDIRNLINDALGFGCEPQTDTVIVASNNQVWVKYECYYDDLPEVSPINELELAVKGYGYFMEGTNPQLPVNKILLTGDEFKVNRGGMFVLPFIAEETPNERELLITSFEREKDNYYLITIDANFSYTNLTVFVRAVGDTDWIETTQSGMYFIVDESLTADVFEIMVTAIDPLTGDVISSEVFTLQAIRIYRVDPSDGGNAVTIWYQKNLDVASLHIDVFGYGSPGVWSYVGDTSSIPGYFSFTPTGDFILKLSYGSIDSNQVPLTIPLDDPIIIV